MASVTFTRCWINLASDLSQSVQLRRRTGGANTGVTGEVRQYAAGRLRQVLQEGKPGQTPVSARLVDRAVIETLKSWCGQTVLVRDERGRSEYGVFFAVPEADEQANRTDIDLTIQHVTYDPSV